MLMLVLVVMAFVGVGVVGDSNCKGPLLWVDWW